MWQKAKFHILFKWPPASNNDFQNVIAKFYSNNMENDALGRVSHMHLALSDIQPEGACDRLAIEVAKSQSVAVDFPKTGIMTEVPAQAVKIVKEHGYPDFMENSGYTKSYLSEKILGKIYRRVSDLIFDDLQIESEELEKPKPDPDLCVPGSQNYAKEAEMIYQQVKQTVPIFFHHIQVFLALC